MKYKFNPFGSPKEYKFLPVGTEETGVIYLLKKGSITPKENPQDMQEASRKQAELVALMKQGQLRLAEAKGISEDEANELLYPQTINGVVVEAKENLFNWLEHDERVKLLELQSSAATRIKAATLFMTYRLGYPVVLRADAKPRSTTVKVEPLRFPLAIGSEIKFPDGIVLELTESADVESEELQVKLVPIKLEAGEVGFLIDPLTRKEKVGISDWKEDDTKDLFEEQINAIFEFYQSEIGINTSEGKSTSENKLKDSEPTPNQNQLTGSNTISESNPTESTIPSSNGRALETAPIG